MQILTFNTLHNVCAVQQGVCCIPKNFQYTGEGYHEYTGGGVPYTGRISRVHWYHDKCGEGYWEKNWICMETSVYWTSPGVLVIFPPPPLHIHHGIPPNSSWYPPDELIIPPNSSWYTLSVIIVSPSALTTPDVLRVSLRCTAQTPCRVFNPLLDRGERANSLPSWSFNTAQKSLGVGSRNVVTFSFNIQQTLSNGFWSRGTLGVAISNRRLAKKWCKITVFV